MDQKERLRRVFSSVLEVPLASIEDDSTLYSLCVDSLESIELLMDVEDVFGIEIADSAWEACKTFDDYYRLVAK